MTYTQSLEYLELPSLWHRRLRGDIIQTLKIINCIDDMNYEKFFLLTDYDGTRNSHNKLYTQYALAQSKKSTFSRSAPAWNTNLSPLIIIIIIIMVIFRCYFSGEHIALSIKITTTV